MQNPKEVLMDKQNKEHMMKPIGGGSKNTLFVVIASFLVVLVGVGTGWLLAGKPASKGAGEEVAVTGTGMVEKQGEAGVEDTSEFDAKEIEGKLVEGGISGEGTHHLEREGGESQNVYLTSSVVDLQSFVGKRVKIWGQSMSGKNAGWLVDVGKIKVVE